MTPHTDIVRRKEYLKQYQQIHKEQRVQYDKKYRQTHKEQLTENKKKYYESHREQVKVRSRRYSQLNFERLKPIKEAYRLAHKNEMKKYRREWYLVNKAKVQLQSKEYYRENKEKINVRNRQYSQRTTLQLRLDVQQKLGGKCVRCGINDWRVLQVDHVKSNGREELRTLGNTRGIYKRVLTLPIEQLNSEYQLLCANCNWVKMYEQNEFHRIVTPYNMSS